MSDTRTISEVMAGLRNRTSAQSKLVRDWKEMLPPGSRWFPGCPGDPACKECEGIGYIRIEGLHISHPLFGKLVLCDCTAGRVAPTKPKQWEPDNRREMPEYPR